MKNHLKRIAAPRTWSILRKQNVFVARPNAGKQFTLSLPLGFIVKELLHVCQTTKQVKAMLNEKAIIVEGKSRSDHRYPVGLFEVIELVPEKKSYRVCLSAGGKLVVKEIAQAEKTVRLQKVVGKKIVKKNMLQLSLLNGSIVQFADATKVKDAYVVGDSVVLDEKNKVVKQYKLTEGSVAQFIGGKHIGKAGVVKSLTESTIAVESDGKIIETLKKYACAIGDSKAVITM